MARPDSVSRDSGPRSASEDGILGCTPCSRASSIVSPISLPYCCADLPCVPKMRPISVPSPAIFSHAASNTPVTRSQMPVKKPAIARPALPMRFTIARSPDRTVSRRPVQPAANWVLREDQSPLKNALMASQCLITRPTPKPSGPKKTPRM